jgi:hypothetical protein
MVIKYNIGIKTTRQNIPEDSHREQDVVFWSGYTFKHWSYWVFQNFGYRMRRRFQHCSALLKCYINFEKEN